MLKKSATVLVLIIVLTSFKVLIGQDFMSISKMKKIYVIDTISIENAYLIYFRREEVVPRLYGPDESLEFYYSGQMIITNDSCYKEILSKGLSTSDVYLNCGFLSMREIDFFQILENTNVKIGRNLYYYFIHDSEPMYEQIYNSDSLKVFKFNKTQSFYVVLVPKNIYCIYYNEFWDLKSEGPLLMLIPKIGSEP